ncbi:MAG: site-2 protease family protein [Candidatus Nanopelagicaceae bacterium]|nr:site-2 protease family protein [Candidatus Nanopelagicaceae bacterium]
MGIIGVLAFVAALLLSVMVHEYGHYATARRYGMRVTEFFLGFGKRIWSTQRGETEFGLKAIPAGGYCKISGMSMNEPLEDDVKHRAFYLASTPKKLVVLGAGSFLHFILGFVLLFTLFAGVGTSQVLPKVSQVVDCVPSTSECTANDPISPAKQVGILPGDEIIGVNGVKMNWDEVGKILRGSAQKPITLIVLRDNQELNIEVIPATRVVEGESRGFLGIINEYGLVRKNPISAIGDSVEASVAIFQGSLKALVGLPAQIPALVRQTFLGEERQADGLVGIVGVARASGETVSSGVLTTGEKFATFLLIVASLNIFVGIFNLLPILPLDGGHMAVALYEGGRRKFAQLRGRPDPGFVDVEKLTPITMVVFLALAFLTLLLLFADIFNPINLNL